MTAPAVTLALRGLRKSFGATQALAGVDLEVRAGEVHALIGQNGSGKSTLIKLLAGYHTADRGTITVMGQPLRAPFGAAEARARGLAFMHQDLALAPALSVLENLRVGRYDTTGYGRVRWRSEAEVARSLLADIGLELDPRRPLRSLQPSERALVGFVRARQDLGDRPGLLVLDEPTAYLPGPAVATLFDAVRKTVADGSSVLFVSHRLDEILAIADRISVLRNGELVATVEAATASRAKLVELILGRDLGQLYPQTTRRPPATAPVLRARGISGAIATDVTIELNPGEITGITGLLGMGHDEVPYLLFGATAISTGTISIGDEVHDQVEPPTMRRSGVALLPADRAGASGAGRATVLENVSLPGLRAFAKGLRLDHAAEKAAVKKVLDDFEVKPPSPSLALGALSGGNQQKALLGKWMHTAPKVLLLHEPTQGVDVGSRKQLFRLIRDAADSGTAILIASAEYEDLANVADRVLVMRHGHIVANLEGDELDEATILQHCYLASGSSPAERPWGEAG